MNRGCAETQHGRERAASALLNRFHIGDIRNAINNKRRAMQRSTRWLQAELFEC
jgi:hypothetical protein